jgi:DNA-binding transcriptional ArsR family regulator
MEDHKQKSDLQEELTPDYHLVRKTSLIFRAINHKLRQQIIQQLLQHDQMTVTEIFEALFLEQSVASQHLAILRRTGFVKTKREGKYIWYMINPKRLEQIKEVVAILLK